MNTLRVYIDTSVIGGCHDEEFARESRALLRMARERELMLLISQTLIDEIRLAPQKVQQELDGLPEWSTELLPVNRQCLELRDAYLEAGFLGQAHSNDALHVANATIARADLIVSWNFKHIVHFDKIRGFNAVNLREGYLPIEIRSPMEVV